MKHRNPYIRVTLEILICATVMTLQGCQASATKRLTLANEAYVGVLKSVNDLHDAGKLTAPQLQAIEPYRATAAAALDKAKAARDAGDVTGLQQALAAAEGAIEAIVNQRDAATGKSTP